MLDHSAIDRLAGGVIISCQAGPKEPLHGPVYMSAMARAAEAGGAAGFRVNGVVDVWAVRQVSRLPIIGINKLHSDEYPVYITPTFASARVLAEAGADLIALDCTLRPRPEPLAPLVQRIRSELRLPVMADCATLDDATAAAKAGADILATTLSEDGALEDDGEKGPDFALLERMVKLTAGPVIAEGRFKEPAHIRRAFGLGAFAVVVGTAVTRPQWLAARLVRAAGESRK
jgi:putative N-acetylmannosamine-6-phosphate epimerase